MTEITTYFGSAERIKNTRDGNPVWILHTASGDFQTEADAQVGYTSFDSLEGKWVKITVNERGRVTLIIRTQMKE